MQSLIAQVNHSPFFLISRPIMAQRDFYEVLGVSRSSSQDEIRRAYKKLAKKHHPDVKPDDPHAQTAFAEITEAYEVLGDEEKRRKYDQFGHAFRGAGAQRGRGNPFEQSTGSGEMPDLESIFSGMFGRGGSPFSGAGGGRRSASRPQKGHDAQAEIMVPFQVAVEGGTHEVSVQHNGRTERLSVRIPAGIEDGKVIRLTGQGTPGGQGVPAGDLLLTVRVAPHPWFRRESLNLLVDVPITPSEAALGAKIDVPTLTEGSLVLSVPAGTPSGARLRLRGKGLLDPKTQKRGDQLVVVKIVVPRTLSDEAKDLYEKLAQAAPLSPRVNLWV